MLANGAFVVSSGRCGSTLVSRLLNTHPHLLSIQELLAYMGPFGLGNHVMTGPQFWDLLCRPYEALSTLARVDRLPPELSHRDRARTVQAEPRSLSRILVALLATSDRPDETYCRLASEVPAFPELPLPSQYRRLFGLLTARLGRSAWVERSGGSSLIAADLVRMFQAAKFVHLQRNGVDAALSMSRHPVYQLMTIRRDLRYACGHDPYGDDGEQRALRNVPARLAGLLPENLTAAALDQRATSPSRFLLAWSFMTMRAESALKELPIQQVHRLWFEDLLTDPYRELVSLGEFLELPDLDAWARQAASGVRAPHNRVPADDPLRDELAAQLSTLPQPRVRSIS